MVWYLSLEAESKVIGATIFDYKLFQQYELKKEWLFYKPHKEIYEALAVSDEGYADFSELLMKIQEFYPRTNWTEESLEMLSFKFYDLKDYQAGVHLLERQYLSDLFQKANESYMVEPTAEKRRLIKDRLQALEEHDNKKKDDGELEAAVNELMDKMENGGEVGLKSYKKIDRILGGGLPGGTLLTIGARPAVGKTAYVINYVMQVLLNQPEANIDLFTLEMSKGQMLDRFVSRITGINSYNLRKPDTRLTDEQKEKVTVESLKLLKTGLRVYDDLYSIEKIEKQIRRRVHEVGRENYIAVIDYIGLVEVGNSRMDRHLQVGEITRTLKKLTNSLNIPIVALSQLNRAVENRQDKKPNLSDLRESGSIEQDSSIVGFLHRDEDDETMVILSIAKNRYGHTGSINYRFHGASMYFDELD